MAISESPFCVLRGRMLTILLVVLSIFGMALSKFDLDLPPSMFLNDNDLTELYARDIEPVPRPLAFGHKYMTGGTGEGMQQLRPEKPFEYRQQVKTDALLPAYCNPPNPCPRGFSVEDGCMSENFENTAQFSRDYQNGQNCLCDQEHMFSCPGTQNEEEEENEPNMEQLANTLEQMLGEYGFIDQNNLVAKKFHLKRTENTIPRRKKRNIRSGHQQMDNPYLKGEPLDTVVKKDGHNLN